MIKRQIIWILLTSVAIFIISCQKSASSPGLGPETIDRALENLRFGETIQAIELLQRTIQAYPEGRLGDRAALVLGNILIERGKQADAIDPLRRAVRGVVAPNYARILMIRAIVEGGLEGSFIDAQNEAENLIAERDGTARPLLQEEAHFLLLKLHSVRRQWPNAGDVGSHFLDRWPRSSYLDEVKWHTAEALRQSYQAKKAIDLYATLWYEAPGSPWALEARDRLHKIEESTGARARRLTADEHYDFIKTLRRYGLHQAALEELDKYFATSSQHKIDGALFMKAMSLHDLRKNSECVATVEELRRHHPNSKWLPAAAIYAIKALRRNDNTPQVREWANWVTNTYPQHPKSVEARYNLGVYLGNVVSENEGLRVLGELVEKGGSHGNVVDSLWKIAWIYQRLGDRDRVLAAFNRILAEHPDSGYRKAALYWSARLLERSDRHSAVALFQQCVEEFPHDYYGHKSLDNLLILGERPRQIGHRKPFPRMDLLGGSAFSDDRKEVRFAAFLVSVGLYRFAAAELATIQDASNDLTLQFALADLYSRSGDPWKAIDILNHYFKDFVVAGSRDADVVPRDFWYILYPYNHRAAIGNGIREAGLTNAGIDPYLVAALIRMESRFLPRAISHVGALGLMQLMPRTAQEIANERGLLPPTRSELFNPSTNIRYGTFYLAGLVREFGDWFPAICSYNAGISPVQRWWNNRTPGQPIDEFVELIPYSATRLYLKRILGDYRNYEWLYKQEN